MDDLVRVLLIGALAAALVGCSSAPQLRHQAFEYGHRGLYQTHYEQSSKLHSKRSGLHGSYKTNVRHRKGNYYTKIAESHVLRSIVPPDEKSNIVTTTPPVTTKNEIPPSSPLNDQANKTDIPPSSQLDDQSVIKKAKATIAAKMSDPNSVEFEGMERAARKNGLGKSINAICGFVTDKDSGLRPFLYLVQTDEAYVGGYNIATSEYRNICSITTLPTR